MTPNSRGQPRPADAPARRGPRASLQALERLRLRLRRLLPVDGAVAVMLAGFGLIALSFVLDYTLTLPAFVGIVFLFAGISLVGRRFISQLLRPLSRRVSDRDLAILVEDRNPQLHQAFITAIELGSGQGEAARYASPELLQSVIDDVERQVGAISFDRVFRAGRLDLSRHFLLVLVAGMLGLASIFPDHAKIWFQRNVLIASTRWPKATWLEEPVLPEAIAIGDNLPLRVRVLRGSPKLV